MSQINIGPDGLLADTPSPAEQQIDTRVSALGALDQLRQMLLNPQYQKLEQTMEEAATKCLDFIVQMQPVSIYDLVQREQMFGEWRALRRLAAERQDLEQDLIQAEQDKEAREVATKVTTNTNE